MVLVIHLPILLGGAAPEFYASALLDKRTQKFYPMWAIRVTADEGAVDAVLAYLEREVKRLERPTPGDPGDACADGLAYLARFQAVDQRIPPLFDRFRRAGYLLPT